MNQTVETTSEKALDSVEIGETAVVSDLAGCPSDLLNKLVSMGLVAGSKVTVTQRGFFGSPINVRLFGSVLSLRSAEAAFVQVQPV